MQVIFTCNILTKVNRRTSIKCEQKMLTYGVMTMKAYLRTNEIRKKLIRKNLSQNWLALQIGVSSGYMSQLMDGSRRPSARLRQKMMDRFPDSSFDDLFIIKGM